MKYIFQLFFIMFYFVAFSWGQAQESNFKEQLSDLDDYFFCSQTVSHFEYQSMVKFSITLDENNKLSKIYFQHSQIKYHADFLKTLKQFRGMDSSQIERIAQYTKGRKVFLGTLLIKNQIRSVPSPDRMFEMNNDYFKYQMDFDLMSEDTINAEQVSLIYNFLWPKIQGVASQLSYLPTPSQKNYVLSHQQDFEQLKIPVAFSKNPDQAVCYTSGIVVGQVKRIKNADLLNYWKKNVILPTDILVMDEAPRNLPPYGALIVSSPSSPSSHPALLAEMTKSPFLYIPGAFNSDRFIKMEASGRAFLINVPASGANICQWLLQDSTLLYDNDLAFLNAAKTPAPINIQAPKEGPIDPINLLNSANETNLTIGPKAKNMSLLMKWIPEGTVDKGMAIPLSLYTQFLKNAKGPTGVSLEEHIHGQLAKIATSKNNEEVLETLASIRNLIQNAEVPTDLANKIIKGLTSVWPNGTRLKFRSSSNVEDGDKFNGAGLYDSEGACLGDDLLSSAQSVCNNLAKRDPVLTAVKKVWASIFNDKAYFMRRYFSADEEKVAMGILVHPSYKGEAANGVAISEVGTDYTGSSFFTLMSTGFPGEDLSVTNPPSGKVPETARIESEKTTIVVPSTELPLGRDLLQDKEYQSLYQMTQKVHSLYGKVIKKAEAQYKLDFEWKKSQKGAMVIKQFRLVPGQESESSSTKNPARLMIGIKNGKLCPLANESDDGLSHMILNRPMYITISSFSLPEKEQKEISSPLKSLSVENESGLITKGEVSPLAQVQYQEWRQNMGMKDRNVTIVMSAQAASLGTYFLKLNLVQRVHEKQGRIEFVKFPATSIRERSIFVEFKKGNLTAILPMLVSVNPKEMCQLDMYQGVPPRSFLSFEDDSYQPRVPYAIEENFSSQGTTSVPLKIKAIGQTSVGGVDKTTFIHVDRFVIEGLVANRELEFNSPSVVYAPAHHNFSYEYVADLTGIKGVLPPEVIQWKKEGFQYLSLKTKEGSWSEVELSLIDLNGNRKKVATLSRN